MTDDLADIHFRAVRQFDRIQLAVENERSQCLEDRRFYAIAGAQWDGDLGEQFENKPRLEANKIQLAMMRLFSDYRNNRISLKFVPKDGSEHAELSEICAGLFRADEQDCNADEAYDLAFEDATSGGFSALRLRTIDSNADDIYDDSQRIVIEPVYDADSCVYFDLDAKRQDKSDATYCFILTAYQKEEYEELYDESVESWDNLLPDGNFDWYDKSDIVYVAEYFVTEEHDDTILIFADISGREERHLASSLSPEDFAFLKGVGTKKIREKKITVKKVHKYVMSGNRILEDHGIIAGNRIPVVPVYGRRFIVNNVERCVGHVRLCKDMQRLKNMQISKLAELSAISSNEKPIFAPEQIAQHENMWANDNLDNNPYLLVNPVTDMNGNEQFAGPLGYTKPPQIPPAMATLLQTTEDDIRDILGNNQEGEKITSNISGDAISLVQQRLDMLTFIYVSNMAKAKKTVGEIWLGMARDVYVEDRRLMKTIGEQGEVSQTDITAASINDDGRIETGSIFERAPLEVTVDVGPSSTTRKESVINSLLKMVAVSNDEETKQVISAMALMNMEGEGTSDMNDYFRRKLVRMGVVKPTDEEKEQLQAEMQNQ